MKETGAPIASTPEEQQEPAELEPPYISVIIPVWNRCEDLKDTLQQLQRQTYQHYEVLVVDDGSTEPVAAMVREHYPSVRYFRLPENKGAGVARNLGMREAKGEIVLFLDSDTVPEDRALEKCARKFAAEPDLAVVSGLQYDATTGQPWWWWTQHGYDEAQYLRVEFETAFKFAEGASAARKAVALSVGGYPEDLFMAGEGRDLAARITDAGYRVMYWPEVTFLHKPAQRLKTNRWYRSDGRLYLEFRNEFWYTVKYFPLPLLLAKTALNLELNFRRAVQHRALAEFFRAYRDAIKGLPAHLKRRQVLKPATIYKITSSKYKNLLGPLAPGKKDALAEAATRGVEGKSLYRFGFVMQQVLGHIAAYQNFRRFAEQDASVQPAWEEVTFVVPGGWIERVPFVPAEVKGLARGALQVRQGLWKGPYDAALFSTQSVCLFIRGYLRGVPSVIVTDVTPHQYDLMGEFYQHPQPKDSALSRYKHRVYVDIYRSVRLIAPWSNWVKGSLMRDYGVPPEKIIVVPPGVDVERWAPPPAGVREASLAASGQLPRVLFVGGDFARKGGPLLLEWFTQRGQGRCELHLVTRTPLTLDQMPPGLHIYNGLEANDPKLMRLYRESHIFVLPTLADCFSVASIEAMATGLPVITTSVGGVPDIVTDGQEGFLIESQDSAALADALERLLEDGVLRQAMGERARATVLERFDAHKNTERLIELMKGLAAPHGISQAPRRISSGTAR